MQTDLAQRSCGPCRSGALPLSQAEAESLRRAVPDWALLDGATRVERRYAFKGFKPAFRFVEGLAALAEAEGHHPDITFGWGYAVVSLQTHTIKGLHQNDFILAAKADQLFATAARCS